jgi:hypothetical protein
MKKTLAGIAILMALLWGAAVFAQTQLPSIYLNANEAVTVFCTGNRLAIERAQDKLSAYLVCRGQPTPTSTPVVPTATPTSTPVPVTPTFTPTPVPPSPTPGHVHQEADLYWHPPGGHGDRPPHEHGDPPPQWLLDAGIRPSFTHVAGTPGENHAYYKHTAFKGWSSNFNGQDWYGVFHLDFNPSGHVSRFHSYQLWVKDATGAISAISGWLDFGVDNETGPQLVPQCGGDDSVRPIMNPPSVGCPLSFESWYARPGGNGSWAPDFGFNVNPNYYVGGDPTNPATWTNTGYVRNLERRIEFAWYLGEGGIRPSPRGEFWTTQWGDIVSGPNDPVCGTQRSYGARSYTVVCLRQYVAPTLRAMTFPGNSAGRVFPGDGVVVLPN